MTESRAAEDKDGADTKAETGTGIEAATSLATAGEAADSMTATGPGGREVMNLTEADTANLAGSMSEVDAGAGEAAQLATVKTRTAQTPGPRPTSESKRPQAWPLPERLRTV